MKVEVKFLKSVYPYNEWDVGYIEENKVEFLWEKVEKLPKKKNKAILKPKKTKWL